MTLEERIEVVKGLRTKSTITRDELIWINRLYIRGIPVMIFEKYLVTLLKGKISIAKYDLKKGVVNDGVTVRISCDRVRLVMDGLLKDVLRSDELRLLTGNVYPDRTISSAISLLRRFEIGTEYKIIDLILEECEGPEDFKEVEWCLRDALSPTDWILRDLECDRFTTTEPNPDPVELQKLKMVADRNRSRFIEYKETVERYRKCSIAGRSATKLLRSMARYTKGWEPDWTDPNQDKYIITYDSSTKRQLKVIKTWNVSSILAFPTEEIANDFRRWNDMLIKDYFSIRKEGEFY